MLAILENAAVRSRLSLPFFLVVIGTALLRRPVAAQTIPPKMTECEGGQCVPGGGGPGIWTFNGRRGHGQWPGSGAIANLTVERFDPDDIVIKRTDVMGRTPGITAIYTGKLRGNRIDGDVTWSWPGHWNKSPVGKWYAIIEDAGDHSVRQSGSSPNTTFGAREAPVTPTEKADTRGVAQTADSTMFQTLSPNDPPDVRKASGVDAWVHARTFEGQEKYRDALFWYERAADRDYWDAAADIGFLYHHGLGVTASKSMAARWYEAGVKAGNMVAMQRLALLLFNGFGVPKDPNRALDLINKAYDKGDSDAAFGLAMLYQYGAPGVRAQSDLAASWFQKAIAELREADSKPDSLCRNNIVRGEMAESMAKLLRGLYTGPQSSMVFAMLAGTEFPLPPADARAYQADAVEAIVRHGESEAECEATFSTDPRNWTFRVNRISDGGRESYLVINATGAQWVRLTAIRAEMLVNGVRIPMGLQNLHDFDSH